MGSRGKTGWTVGTVALLVSKCIENMELGHNIIHGQWDWMNDPEIHSNTWEWDMVGPSSQWRYAHNYRHHVFANVIGMDDDLGFGVIRVSRDQEWKPGYLWAPLRALGLSIVFEWGIALHNLASEQRDQPTEEAKAVLKRAMFRKMVRQAAKDYLFFPALSGRRWLRTFLANLVAAGFRNGWAYIVIVCGREIHARSRGERDEAGMVSAADAGNRELQRGPRPEVDEWKPLLPNRAPPVPRSAEQQVPRDCDSSAGNPG
jgi:NADPH-dependent stearoyl-CoA 9-desaturase